MKLTNTLSVSIRNNYRENFWDYFGGAGTFEDLIKIYEEVGEEIRPELEKKFKKITVAIIALWK